MTTDRTLFPSIIRLGTRGSALSQWQTNFIADQLCQHYPHLTIQTTVISTRGDRILDTPLPLIGGKGVFTAELEEALSLGEIDLAVHSLKDVPTQLFAGLAIGAIPLRAPAHDVLISRARHTVETLPRGAVIGSSSQRRKAQLLARRPDLVIKEIRGNIDTRIRKAMAEDGPYDGIILAEAGVGRLQLSHLISQHLSIDLMFPAPGQGALAVQCRDEGMWHAFLSPLHHRPTARAVSAERAFLAELGGGCSLPVAAYCAPLQTTTYHLRGRVCALDGQRWIDVESTFGEELSAETAGYQLALTAQQHGAQALLGGVR